MSHIFRAFCWAMASLLVAIASIFELIPAASAQTLIIVIPALMIATTRSAPCARLWRSA